jgi:hypothetical protein
LAASGTGSRSPGQSRRDLREAPPDKTPPLLFDCRSLVSLVARLPFHFPQRCDSRDAQAYGANTFGINECCVDRQISTEERWQSPNFAGDWLHTVPALLLGCADKECTLTPTKMPVYFSSEPTLSRTSGTVMMTCVASLVAYSYCGQQRTITWAQLRVMTYLR